MKERILENQKIIETEIKNIKASLQLLGIGMHTIGYKIELVKCIECYKSGVKLYYDWEYGGWYCLNCVPILKCSDCNHKGILYTIDNGDSALCAACIISKLKIQQIVDSKTKEEYNSLHNSFRNESTLWTETGELFKKIKHIVEKRKRLADIDKIFAIKIKEGESK